MQKAISILILISFVVTGQIGACPVYAQELVLSAPGQMVALSPAFTPAVLKGIKLDPNNPFRFHFFVDSGDSQLKQEDLKSVSSKLIKYFLASLTIPEQDLWVNLSPYEKDRIVPQEFGQTEMGRDLLAQDYMLKQITASLIYPESSLGKEFWQKVYTQAQAKYGTGNIPINTFNKVWIVPEKAVVYENGGTAFVLESHLKVMLEEDYLALSRHPEEAKRPKDLDSSPPKHVADQNDINALGSQIVREIVIPALTKEVNEGKNFAQLRQVFYSLILATWYKKKIKVSILNKVYSNQNKIGGVNVSVEDKGRIYQEYLKAFKKGVYNYIKEESDSITGQAVPRKYVSGGVIGINIDNAMIYEDNAIKANQKLTDRNLTEIVGNVDLAMAGGDQDKRSIDLNLERWFVLFQKIASPIHPAPKDFLIEKEVFLPETSNNLRRELNRTNGPEAVKLLLYEIATHSPDTINMPQLILDFFTNTRFESNTFSPPTEIKDTMPVSFETIIFAVAAYILAKNLSVQMEQNDFTKIVPKEDLELLQKFIDLYNSQSNKRFSLSLTSIFPLIVTPFYTDYDDFRKMHRQVLSLPDDNNKVVMFGLHLFLAGSHMQDLGGDDEHDLQNMYPKIKYLLEKLQDKNLQLTDKERHMAESGLLKVLTVLIPYLASSNGEIDEYVGNFSVRTKVRYLMRNMIGKNKKYIRNIYEERRKSQDIEDPLLAGFSYQIDYSPRLLPQLLNDLLGFPGRPDLQIPFTPEELFLNVENRRSGPGRDFFSKAINLKYYNFEKYAQTLKFFERALDVISSQWQISNLQLEEYEAENLRLQYSLHSRYVTDSLEAYTRPTVSPKAVIVEWEHVFANHRDWENYKWHDVEGKVIAQMWEDVGFYPQNDYSHFGPLIARLRIGERLVKDHPEMTGLDHFKLALSMVRQPTKEINPLDYYQMFYKHVLELYNTKLRIKIVNGQRDKDLQESLAALKELKRRNVPLYLVSYNPALGNTDYLKWLGLEGVFQEVITPSVGNIANFEKIDVYREIVKRHKDVIAIGSGEDDLIAAKASGAIPVIFSRIEALRGKPSGNPGFVISDWKNSANTFDQLKIVSSDLAMASQKIISSEQVLFPDAAMNKNMEDKQKLLVSQLNDFR